MQNGFKWDPNRTLNAVDFALPYSLFVFSSSGSHVSSISSFFPRKEEYFFTLKINEK